MTFRPLATAAISALLLLSACQDSGEQAEKFYQSGLELLEEGDPARAAVEFRNVFRYDGEHREARRQLAEILIDEGKIGEGYGQYLRLAEQYPEDAEIRYALADLALEENNWDEAERHGRMAVELDPDAPRADDITVALDYRQAILDEDAEARAAEAAEARAILGENPESLIARRVLIAQSIEEGRYEDALDHIDAAIAQVPENLAYSMLKLQTLGQLGDLSQIGAHLEEMYRRFPESEKVQQTLISWYMQQEDYDGAEMFLRELAGEDTADPTGHVTLVQFLETARGREAAKAEIERLIAANADNPANQALYRSMRAAYTFQEGDRDAAIAEMQRIVENAEPSEQTMRLKAGLARMLLSTGDKVGARAVVEEILAADTTNVAALKLRGAMLIDSDDPEAAIIDLRRALDQNPLDPEISTLLADAHERGGSPELQGERLATAVQVSNSGPAESLRYAAFLIDDGHRAAARSVLADARRAHPADLDLLMQIGRLALGDNNPGKVRGVIADLRLIRDNPRAADMADAFEAQLLLQQNRIDESVALLEERLGDGDANAALAIVRTQVNAGNLEAARDYLDQARAGAPDDIGLRLVEVALLQAEGKPDEAEAMLRGILAEAPGSELAVRQLYTILAREGRTEEMAELLDTALAAAPDSRFLRLLKAGERENAGDVEGAIAIYEELYEENSSDVVIANNLASLLTSYSDSPEALERASAVARRLRGTDVPAFMDTYGWIAYREGNFEEAVTYLEGAAEGLPNDPLVRFHLGMAYAALDRAEAARTALETSIELAGDRPLPQMEEARQTLATLETTPESGGGNDL